MPPAPTHACANHPSSIIHLPSLLLLLLPALAIAAPPGQTLPDQLNQAYDNTNQYHAITNFAVIEQRGRWTTEQRADFTIALDREWNRVLVDVPEVRLVIADGTLRLKSDQIPGRYLELPAPNPLTYEAIVQAVPFITEPPLIDLALLLAEDPATALGAADSAEFRTLAADQPNSTHPRLQLPTQQGPLTLQINPQTNLASAATLDLAGHDTALKYDINVQAHNQSLPDDIFAFDTTGLDATRSLQEFVGSAAGGRNQSDLVGKPAPDINLPTLSGEQFTLSEVEQPIVILNFWATWCPPCREELPHLQALHEWIEETDANVALMPINQMETEEEAKQYWQDQNYTMPTALDTNATASQAYNVQSIPRTVIIHNGKVTKEYHGLPVGQNMTDLLKQDIQNLQQKEQGESGAD